MALPWRTGENPGKTIRRPAAQLLASTLMASGCASTAPQPLHGDAGNHEVAATVTRDTAPPSANKIAMLEIVDMAGSFEEDKFEELAARIDALPGKQTDNGYEVGPHVLSDETEISSATVFRKSGKLISIRIALADATCLPTSAVVLRTYATGPIYSHDYGRYETITPWVKVIFAPSLSGTCLRTFVVERPPPNDFEVEHFVAMNPIGPFDIKRMDVMLWLFSQAADPSLGKIYKIIETGHIEEWPPTPSSDATDKYKITYAKKSLISGRPFAILLGFSDDPCYPLARALSLTRARIEMSLSNDDAARFQSFGSDIGTWVYPHKHSPLCLGFIRAFDG